MREPNLVSPPSEPDALARVPRSTLANASGSDGPRNHTLLKYWKILRVSLIERMAYRGDFLLGSFLRFLPMLTTILLWTAIYSGAEAAGREELAGYRYREMIAY